MELAQQPEWKQILVDVVKKENIDPWDVNISIITDKFMIKLKEMKKFDFRIPANAILASSILLRLKSDSWVVSPILQDIYDDPVHIPDGLIHAPVFPNLQPVFRETQRKVTLDELINAIEDVMHKEKIKTTNPKGKIKTEIPQALIDLVESNEQDFEKRLDLVYEKIKLKKDKENLVTMSNLIETKEAGEFVNHFVPVLHLANKRILNVWQEEVFGEIFIHLIETNGKKRVKKNVKSKKSQKAS